MALILARLRLYVRHPWFWVIVAYFILTAVVAGGVNEVVTRSHNDRALTRQFDAEAKARSHANRVLLLKVNKALRARVSTNENAIVELCGTNEVLLSLLDVSVPAIAAAQKAHPTAQGRRFLDVYRGAQETLRGNETCDRLSAETLGG